MGHLGSKTMSPGQIKGKHCFHSKGLIVFYVIIMNIAQNVCLDDFKVKFKTGSLGQKLGHCAISKKNLVNTPSVT